jgi:sulfopyruvate decarboxylase subunit alpha
MEVRLTDRSGPELILEGLKEASVGFVTPLPDANLAKLLALVDADPELPHVTMAREEEGIGICTGAYMGGRTPAIIMQNGGLLNSCNALTITALKFQYSHPPVDLLRGRSRRRRLCDPRLCY